MNLAKPYTQGFIDNTTETLYRIKNDKYIKINTTELEVQLDSAETKNIARLKFIQEITEVDTDINYKKKTISYIKLLDTLLNNEFKVCLTIIGQNQDKRFEDCKEFMMPRLRQLKSVLSDYLKTQNDFENKYKFKAPTN